MFSEKFNKEVEKSIQELKNYLEAIDKIKTLDVEVDRNLLDTIKKQDKKILKKLENKEFEVAVVGLEKAGKSTFINALIENKILPSAPERCTFTATRLVYGDDEAIVEFFSEDEFNKIFYSMLLDIQYPNVDKVSFDTLNKETFERYFESLEKKNPELYKMHLGKTNEEIIDIIENKNTIKQYLNQPPKVFKGDELLGNDFQEFIRGEKVGKQTKTGKPRSVKKIEIKSSKLSKMPNAIIYDVPGFDSPTRIHERQTLERLKHADAIILVTNAGRNPSLRGPELNILLKNSDEDGIALKDKLFIFGNQLDLAEDFEHNKEILLNDVKKYKIAKENRVVTGSAKQFLIKKRLEEGKVLNNFDDGIEKIYNEIVNYYENERFYILKNRIEKNKDILQNIINEVKSKLLIKDSFEELTQQRTKIILQTIKEIETKIKKELDKLNNKIKKQVNEEKYFSREFEQRLNNENVFKEIDKNFLKDVYIRVDNTVSLEYPVEKVNERARDKLYIKFLKELKRIVKDMTDEKAKEYENEINKIIAQAVGINDDKEIKTFLNEILKDKKHHFNRFEALIERFSRNIFDILILYSVGSNQRLEKFKETAEEFRYLGHYFGNVEEFVDILLSQKEYNGKIIDALGVAKNFTKIHSPTKKIFDIAEFVLNLDKLVGKFDRSKTEEDLLEEINKDINFLKEVLKKAVIPACNLELVFFTNFDMQIKTIIDAFKIEDENYKKMEEFLSKLVFELKANELKSLESIEEENKRKKEIKSFLEKISL